MKTKNPHADLIVEFYTNFINDSDEHKNWQYKIRPDHMWMDCRSKPVFNERQSYRRKAKQIRIGEFDVPEPLRIAPELGTSYWVPQLFADCHAVLYWGNDATDLDFLARGVCHLTKEAAQLHSQALLSFTQLKYINLDPVGIE